MSITNLAGQRGEQTVSGYNAGNVRVGALGDLIFSELQGRYAEMAYNKRIFTAVAMGVATTVVGTGMIGLQLWNRTTSSNLVLLKASGMTIVTSASETDTVLAFGSGQTSAPSGQTAITGVTNNFLGGAAPGALALNAGTFTNAPVAMWNLMHNTAAIATTGEDIGFSIDFEGSIIVPPNYYVAFATVGAAAASGGQNLSLMWYEAPV